MRRKKRSPQLLEDRNNLKIWKTQVRERAGNHCEYCGFTGKNLQCHHIISARYKLLRYEPSNGILLCGGSCHKFGLHSAHNNPVRLISWLQNNRPISLLVLQEHLKEVLKDHA